MILNDCRRFQCCSHLLHPRPSPDRRPLQKDALRAVHRLHLQHAQVSRGSGSAPRHAGSRADGGGGRHGGGASEEHG